MKIQLYLKCLIIFLLTACNSSIEKAIEPTIIPKPLTQKTSTGVFVLNSDVYLSYDPTLKEVSSYLISFLEETYEYRLSSMKNSKKINLKIDDSIKNDEGYELKVEKNDITIRAKNSKGAFYAVQSLLQLLPIQTKSNSIEIQCLEIKDEPRFKYRGMHLDVGRHFFSVDFIKKYIDLIARLKMNTFHWHLTEDQGWRIEIKKYPKLQEIAAFRLSLIHI